MTHPLGEPLGLRPAGQPGGTVIDGFLGLISSVMLKIVSLWVWEATLGNPEGSAPFSQAWVA